MARRSPTPEAPAGSAGRRLPRGRHRVPPELVLATQRRRILAGAGYAVAAHGYSGLSVKLVLEAAGVSRATFYGIFDDKRDCVLAAHRDVFGRLLGAMGRSCEAETEWPRKARTALGAALRLLVAEPGAAQLLTMEGAGSEPAIGRQVAGSKARLAALLREGRSHTRFDPSLPDLTEEAVVGALLSLAAARVDESGAADLVALEPELAQVLLAPYVGAAEAARLARATC